MEVDHDPVTMALCPTSVDARNGFEVNMSKDDQNMPGNKKTKPKQVYNRDSVKIDEFLLKDPGDINAKQMRVLLPAMLQKINYPDKDVTKTKIKGLWEPAHKPSDYPANLPFKDPNNARKMPLDEMRQVFVFLRMKLLQAQNSAEQVHSNTQLKSQMLNTHELQVLGETHSASVNHDEKEALPVVQANFDESYMPIPEQAATESLNKEGGYDLLQLSDPFGNEVLEQYLMSSDEMVFSRNDAEDNGQEMTYVCMLKPVDTTEQAANLQTDVMEQAASLQIDITEQTASFQAGTIEQTASLQTVITEPAASLQTDTTEQAASFQIGTIEQAASLQTDITEQAASLQTEPTEQAASFQIGTIEQAASLQTDITEQAASLQTDITEQAASLQTDTIEQAERIQNECSKYVTDSLSMLEEPVKEFLNVFGGNSAVTEMITKIFNYILTPLSEAAVSGNRLKCLELSECSSSLWNIVKQYSFMGPESDPSVKLAMLYEKYHTRTMVLEDKMPPVDHEVQINNTVVTEEPDYGGTMQECCVQTPDDSDTNSWLNHPKGDAAEMDWSSMSSLGINQHGTVNGFEVGTPSHCENVDAGHPRTTADDFSDGMNGQVVLRCTDTGSTQYAELTPHVPNLSNTLFMEVSTEGQKLINDIIGMECDYLSSDWDKTSKNVSVNKPAAEHEKTIPLTVTEMAEMSDDDGLPCQKRKRKTAKEAHVYPKPRGRRQSDMT